MIIYASYFVLPIDLATTTGKVRLQAQTQPAYDHEAKPSSTKTHVPAES